MSNIKFFERNNGDVMIQGMVGDFIVESDKYGSKIINTRALLAGREYATTRITIDNYMHTPIRNFIHACKLANDPLWILDQNRRCMKASEYIAKRQELLAQQQA